MSVCSRARRLQLLVVCSLLLHACAALLPNENPGIPGAPDGSHNSTSHNSTSTTQLNRQRSRRHPRRWGQWGQRATNLRDVRAAIAARSRSDAEQFYQAPVVPELRVPKPVPKFATPIRGQAGTVIKEVALSPWDTEQDRAYLGNQTTFDPPLRSRSVSTEQYAAKYSSVWSGVYPKLSCWSCHFYGRLTEMVRFHTVLDAGAGNGMGVRMLRSLGKNAYGVELAGSALQNDAKDLLEQGWVEQGSLRSLPFADNSFDAVVSGDVLEHIQPHMVDDVVSELIRVSRRHILLSISLKDTLDGLHTLIRPRGWWEKKFKEHGAEPNSALMAALQRNIMSVYPAPQKYRCQHPGNATDGGVYEVCFINDPWLVGLTTQGNLRHERMVTFSDGDMEPWYFFFRKTPPPTSSPP